MTDFSFEFLWAAQSSLNLQCCKNEFYLGIIFGINTVYNCSNRTFRSSNNSLISINLLSNFSIDQTWLASDFLFTNMAGSLTKDPLCNVLKFITHYTR